MAAFSTSGAVVRIPSFHCGRVSRMLLAGVRTLVQLLLGRVQEASLEVYAHLLPVADSMLAALQPEASGFLRATFGQSSDRLLATSVDTRGNSLLTVSLSSKQSSNSLTTLHRAITQSTYSRLLDSVLNHYYSVDHAACFAAAQWWKSIVALRGGS